MPSSNRRATHTEVKDFESEKRSNTDSVVMGMRSSRLAIP